MDSPCFNLKETRALTPRIEWEEPFDFETSHAGIIRIGFEGISQPHFVEHPCFNNAIETLMGSGAQIKPLRPKQSHEAVLKGHGFSRTTKLLENIGLQPLREGSSAAKSVPRRLMPERLSACLRHG
jgi:hypothetical protein